MESKKLIFFRLSTRKKAEPWRVYLVLDAICYCVAGWSAGWLVFYDDRTFCLPTRMHAIEFLKLVGWLDGSLICKIS